MALLVTVSLIVAAIVVVTALAVSIARDLRRESTVRSEAEACHRAADHCHRKGPERVADELGVSGESLEGLARIYAEENFPPGERFGALKGALSGFESRARSAELMERLEADEEAAMKQLAPEEREAWTRPYPLIAQIDAGAEPKRTGPELRADLLATPAPDSPPVKGAARPTPAGG